MRIARSILTLLLSALLVDSNTASFLRRTSQCPGETNEYLGESIVAFEGDPTTLNSDEIAELEHDYQTSLEEGLDPCYSILGVDLEVNSRRLSSEQDHDQIERRLQNTFVLWYQWACNGCPGGSLFNDASRRRLVAPQGTFSGLSRDKVAASFEEKVESNPTIKEKLGEIETVIFVK
mmetsp:Transcript_8053/g.12321  ORF Transcript_8053/g.12321 Transcript_8053/m.12321 type:complete len:177 (+) Transcript_8053:153-683(+)